MANGISVAVPFVYDKQDGPYRLNKNIEDAVKQNFKNLVLTVKGERIMDPLFGVGIQTFLFDNYSKNSSLSIKSEIFEQTRKYMPFIEVQDFIVAETINPNQFNIYIKYFINSLNILDELSFVVSK